MTISGVRSRSISDIVLAKCEKVVIEKQTCDYLQSLSYRLVNMKPKSLGGARISFPFLPLYLAEICYMIALAKEKDFSCAISDDEHEYEDLDDLIAHCGNRIRKLTMKFSKQTRSFEDVRVVVTYSGVIMTADSGDECVALEQGFRTYLRKRSPWFAFAMNTWLWIVPLGGLVILLLDRSNQSYHPVLSRVLESIFFFDVVMLFISLLVPYYFGGIHLQKKHEVVGFFAKYEKVIIAVLSAAVGVAGKWLLDHSGLDFH